MSLVEGRSGKVARTSFSTRCWKRRNECHHVPSRWATSGSLSGPSSMTTTATMMKSFIGLRLNMLLVYGPASRGNYRKPRRVRGHTRKKALPMISEWVMVPHMRLSQESEWLSPIMK